MSTKSKSSAGTKRSHDDIQKKILMKDPSVQLGGFHRNENYRQVLHKVEDEPDYEYREKIKCIRCFKVFADVHGSHLDRHAKNSCPKRRKVDGSLNKTNDTTTAIDENLEKNRKMEDFNIKKYTQLELTEIKGCLARLFLRSGRAFNQVDGVPIKKFLIEFSNILKSGYGVEAEKQLPCRTTVQKRTEEMAKILVDKVHDYIKPYVGKNMNLIIDHGKHVVNYLSIYVSFLDDNFRLQLIPLAFAPCPDGKTGLETFKLISSRLAHYGFSEEEIRNYIRCVSHSLNLVAQKAIVPLEEHKRQISKDVNAILSRCNDVVKHASLIAMGLRSNIQIAGQLKCLPSLPVETRWLSGVKSVHDCLEMFDEITEVAHLLNTKARNSFNAVRDTELSFARAIVTVLGTILELNDVYQNQSQVTLHLVLPTYKHLRDTWMKLSEGDLDHIDEDACDHEAVRALATAGVMAIDHYYRQFTEVHYAAVLLSPMTKRMDKFDVTERFKAEQFVTDLLPRSRSPTPEPSRQQTSGIAKFLFLVKDRRMEQSSNEELQRYLAEHVDPSSEETLENYWLRKKNEYPSLFQVASEIYSIVPSESVCETAFSQAGYLLDRRRTRLESSKAELVVIGAQLAHKFPDWF